MAHEKLARGVSSLSVKSANNYSLVDLTYVWITGAAVGILGLMIVAMLLGKLNF